MAPVRELELELEAVALLELEQVCARPTFLHALETAVSSLMPQRSKRERSSSWPCRAPPPSARQQATPRVQAPAPVTPPSVLPASQVTPMRDSQPRDNSMPSSSTAPAPEQPWDKQHAGEDEDWEAQGWDAANPVEPGFEIVQNQDVLQAVAYHIALVLSKHPEAQGMTPQQLQVALSGALSVLKQSRSRLGRVCRVGRQVYRWSALTYSALQMYQNPWMVQAILAALWTVSRVGARVLMP